MTRIYGAQDRSIPFPEMGVATGQKDAEALQELIDFLKATNLVGWSGFQSSGTMTSPAGASNPIELTIKGDNHFRLDMNTSSGEWSTRINGSTGSTHHESGKVSSISPERAKAGLFGLPKLLNTSFPRSNVSFLDRGNVTVDGTVLHRVTLIEPIYERVSGGLRSPALTTDFYFDPSTHLLIKSACAVQLDTMDRQRYLLVVTYGDYRTIEGTTIPFSYLQSLNGQQQWSLQLVDVNLQASVPNSYFLF